MCIIETSSGLPQKSSAIFGHLRKFSVNVRERLSGLRDNFGKSSESSENQQKRRQQYVYIIKEHYTLARRYEFYVLVASTISHSFAGLTREILFLPREHKKFISSRHRVISSIYSDHSRQIKLTFPSKHA